MRLAFVVFLVSCQLDPVGSAPTVHVGRDVVEEVARMRREPMQQAADDVMFDAVLGQAALAHGLDQSAGVRQATRAARARWVSDRIAAQAEALGPPTDDELAQETARHWREVDLPEQAHAVHAVVLRAAGDEARAAALAERIRSAVAGADGEADFLARAKAVPAGGLEVRPETLPRFVADGRIVDGDGTMDTAFVRAAFALQPGQTSTVIETQFGWHVIRLLEKIAPHEIPVEERRQKFRVDVIAARGHGVLERLLRELEDTHPVRRDPQAEVWTKSAVQTLR